MPVDFEFAKMFWKSSRESLAQGRIKAARIAADRGRGGKVLTGLKEVELGKASGAKLAHVYTHYGMIVEGTGVKG